MSKCSFLHAGWLNHFRQAEWETALFYLSINPINAHLVPDATAASFHQTSFRPSDKSCPCFADLSILTLDGRERKWLSIMQCVSALSLDLQSRCVSPLTSDTEDSGAFSPTEGVLCTDGVLAHVFRPHAEDQQGANSTDVGDVIVGVGI